MAIVKTRDKVADDRDRKTIIGELWEDGKVRDDEGNVIEPYRGLVNGKAVVLYFTEENRKALTLDELEEIAEEAPEDEAYRNELFRDLEKRAKKAAGGSDGRQKYGTGPARNDTKHIREWLRSQGVEISDRGRIPTDLMNRYNNKNNASAPATGFTSAPDAAPAKQPTKAQLIKAYNSKHGTTLKSINDEQSQEAFEIFTAR